MVVASPPHWPLDAGHALVDEFSFLPRFSSHFLDYWNGVLWLAQASLFIITFFCGQPWIWNRLAALI